MKYFRWILYPTMYHVWNESKAYQRPFRHWMVLIGRRYKVIFGHFSHRKPKKGKFFGFSVYLKKIQPVIIDFDKAPFINSILYSLYCFFVFAERKNREKEGKIRRRLSQMRKRPLVQVKRHHQHNYQGQIPTPQTRSLRRPWPRQ